jgi:hypothetical protein
MKFHHTDSAEVLSIKRIRDVFAVLAVTLTLTAAGLKYRTFSVGDDEALHLIRTDRKEEVVPRDKGQMSFGKVAISQDRQLVGWFAYYPNPFPSAQSTVPQTLVIFHDGQVLRRFTTQQIFWDWTFLKGGTQVAYCDGPPTGGADQCLLRSVDTGKILEKWDPRPEGAPPRWAIGLHY